MRRSTLIVLVATAFPAPGPIPVLISTGLARDVGAHRGSELSITFGTTPIDAVVAGIVPAVPSAPGAAAVLADVDALSRALIVRGDLESPVTAWWVGHPARRHHPDSLDLRMGSCSEPPGNFSVSRTTNLGALAPVRGTDKFRMLGLQQVLQAKAELQVLTGPPAHSGVHACVTSN